MSPARRLEVEPPPAHSPMVGASAWEDEATRSAVAPSWRRRAAIVGAVLVAVAVATSGTPVAWIGFVAAVVLVVGIVVRGALGRRDRRRLRSVLRSGSWQLVNVVMLVDLLARDLSPWEAGFRRGHRRGGAHHGERVVAIIDPGSGEVRGTWLPFTTTRRWPDRDARRWAWFVSLPDGDGAMASIDRTRIVGLRRGLSFRKALHDHAWNVLRSTELPPAPIGGAMVVGDAGVRHPSDEAERWPNRPMTTRARVVIVALLLCVAAVAGLLDARAHLDKVHHNQDLMDNGVAATAVVIDYRHTARSPGRISIRILDGPFAGFAGTRTFDRGRPAEVGDVVTIFHAQGDVDDLLIVGYDQDIRLTGWFALSLAAFVAGVLWLSHRRATYGARRAAKGQGSMSV